MPGLFNRKSIRIPDYDYCLPGAYFVTICAYHRMSLFGKIEKPKSELASPQMHLNIFGEIIKKTWEEIPVHFHNVEVREFSILPNHLHGIIWILGPEKEKFSVGATHASPLQESHLRSHSVGSIVGSFKSAAAKKINMARGTAWQADLAKKLLRTRYP